MDTDYNYASTYATNGMSQEDIESYALQLEITWIPTPEQFNDALEQLKRIGDFDIHTKMGQTKISAIFDQMAQSTKRNQNIADNLDQRIQEAGNSYNEREVAMPKPGQKRASFSFNPGIKEEKLLHPSQLNENAGNSSYDVHFFYGDLPIFIRREEDSYLERNLGFTFIKVGSAESITNNLSNLFGMETLNFGIGVGSVNIPENKTNDLLFYFNLLGFNGTLLSMFLEDITNKNLNILYEEDKEYLIPNVISGGYRLANNIAAVTRNMTKLKDNFKKYELTKYSITPLLSEKLANLWENPIMLELVPVQLDGDFGCLEAKLHTPPEYLNGDFTPLKRKDFGIGDISSLSPNHYFSPLQKAMSVGNIFSYLKTIFTAEKDGINLHLNNFVEKKEGGLKESIRVLNNGLPVASPEQLWNVIKGVIYREEGALSFLNDTHADIENLMKVVYG